MAKTAAPLTYGTYSGGYNVAGGAPSYIKSNTATIAGDVAKQASATGIKASYSQPTNAAQASANLNNPASAMKVVDTRYQSVPVTYTNLNGTSGNPGTGGGGSSSGGGSGGDYSYSGGSSDDILNQIKSLLQEQQEASKKYYETMYNQRMNEINQESTKNRNLINTNYKRGERYLNNLYGNTDSGTNWTNRARNNQNWISQLAANRENTASLKDSAAASRDLGLANAASTLAQGWYNYVLPVYTNRQNTLDDYAYRRYLASL